LFHQASALWFNPEIGRELDHGLDIYKDYVRAIKERMRYQTDVLAANGVLREGARKRHGDVLDHELKRVFGKHPELVSVTIEDKDGGVLARRDRGRPVDDAHERSLDVRRPLADEVDAPSLVATYAISRERLDELESSASLVSKYHQLESSRDELYQGYLSAHAGLLAMTMLVTVALGSILAQGVTRRLARLANACNQVAAGDLLVRVPVTGSDELTELAAVFNRMLEEMEQSRARIEYLLRIGAWQEMAQRLAHEIKNPLTPIQLAVQECHRKYAGSDPAFRNLLDTTLEIVEEEVGTLRRLVGTFSNFARMPHAELATANLRTFLRECSETLARLEDETILGSDPQDVEPLALQDTDISWDLPPQTLEANIDRQLLRRVLINLVRNAVQAIRGARQQKGTPEGPRGEVRVRAETDSEGIVLLVEDNGPGVPEVIRSRVFDPYFTTKADGTGLGLAIVKKIIVEHGGRIEVLPSPTLGGARFTIHLPPVHQRILLPEPPSLPEPEIV
jgi:nitrogen fixation/metabolism regulation signal transduction histidine kinase